MKILLVIVLAIAIIGAVSCVDKGAPITIDGTCTSIWEQNGYYTYDIGSKHILLVGEYPSIIVGKTYRITYKEAAASGVSAIIECQELILP